MDTKLFATINILLLISQFTYGVPTQQNDIDSLSPNIGAEYYNNVMGHFKDFFMYLPVMMTTLKETMTGFPKFAEGIRIMTSKKGRLDDDCKCQKDSNEI